MLAELAEINSEQGMSAALWAETKADLQDSLDVSETLLKKCKDKEEGFATRLAQRETALSRRSTWTQYDVINNGFPDRFFGRCR